MYYGDFSDFGDFGDKIKAARLKMGLNKGETAALIGMDSSYYGYMERSMVLPKYNNLKNVCETLGISFCQLFGNDYHVVFNLKNYSEEKKNLIKMFSQTIDCVNNEKTIDCLYNEKTIDWILEDFFSAFKNLKSEQRQIIAALLEEFYKVNEAG